MAFPDYPRAIDEGLPNGFASSRRGQKVRYFVVHVAAGYYDGTIAWFNDPRAQANSHYVVAQDGRVAQLVDEDWAAWTNYPTNEESVTVEHIDMSASRPGINNEDPGWMTEKQFEASAQLAANVLKRHRLGVSAIKRHTEVGQTSHNCPGPNFPMDRYKRRVGEILGGTPIIPTKPPQPLPKPAAPIYRVVIGQGEDLMHEARRKGFDKAWMLGSRVIVGSGTRPFAVKTRGRAIRAGFEDAWLLAVDQEAPETARPPASNSPSYVDENDAYLMKTVGGKYVTWYSGRFTAGAPAWVAPGKPPAPEVVRRDGAFCAAISLTLPLRLQGKSLPSPADPEWEGGLLDYGRDYVLEQKIAVAYDPDMDIRAGDVGLTLYTGEELYNQGHTWIKGKNGQAIQADLHGGINAARPWRETVQRFAHGKKVYVIRRERIFA